MNKYAIWKYADWKEQMKAKATNMAESARNKMSQAGQKLGEGLKKAPGAIKGFANKVPKPMESWSSDTEEFGQLQPGESAFNERDVYLQDRANREAEKDDEVMRAEGYANMYSDLFGDMDPAKAQKGWAKPYEMLQNTWFGLKPPAKWLQRKWTSKTVE